jgi:hypothetical protein
LESPQHQANCFLGGEAASARESKLPAEINKNNTQKHDSQADIFCTSTSNAHHIAGRPGCESERERDARSQEHQQAAAAPYSPFPFGRLECSCHFCSAEHLRLPEIWADFSNLK